MAIGRRNKSAPTLSKIEKDEYSRKMEHAFNSLDPDDQKKMEFARNYINELELYDATSGFRIILSPMEIKLWEFMIFLVVSDYENMVLKKY